MSMQNARSFDPHNRPLKGEWIVVEGGGKSNATAILSDVQIDTSSTQGFDAVQRTSRPFPIWIIVVAALIVGGAVYAFISSRAEKPTERSLVGTSNAGASGGEAALEGAPVLTRVEDDESHTARRSSFVFAVDLKADGAELDPAKPTEFSIEGGTASQKLIGGKLVFDVTKTGNGQLEIRKLNYKNRPNPNPPVVKPVRWSAPAPVTGARPNGQPNRTSPTPSGTASERAKGKDKTKGPGPRRPLEEGG